MNMYGVYDSVYGDFLESFSTKNKAIEFINKCMVTGQKGFKLVKYLDVKDVMNTDYEVIKFYC